MKIANLEVICAEEAWFYNSSGCTPRKEESEKFEFS
jgi:hypothetical protein